MIFISFQGSILFGVRLSLYLSRRPIYHFFLFHPLPDLFGVVSTHLSLIVQFYLHVSRINTIWYTLTLSPPMLPYLFSLHPLTGPTWILFKLIYMYFNWYFIFIYAFKVLTSFRTHSHTVCIHATQSSLSAPTTAYLFLLHPLPDLILDLIQGRSNTFFIDTSILLTRFKGQFHLAHDRIHRSTCYLSPIPK